MVLTILIVTIVFLVSAYAALVIHEGVHALVAATAPGTRIIEFKPYPHKKSGKWVMGSMSYESTQEFSYNRMVVFLIAPMMFSFLMMLLFWVLGYGANGYLFPVAVAFGIDWLWFLKGFAFNTPQSDGARLRELVAKK